MTRPIALLSAVLGCCCSAAAAGHAEPAFVASHEPIHPGDGEAVTLRLTSNVAAAEASLSVERFKLDRDRAGRERSTLVEGPTTVETCDLSKESVPARCEFTVRAGYPAASFIRFTASLRRRDGTTAKETYSFAAGAYPYAGRPVPVRLTGMREGRLDMVLIPDTDVTVASFKARLDELINGLYFRYRTYGGDLRTNYRSMYNFYYSPEQGDFFVKVENGKEECDFKDPSNMAAITLIGDAIVFLHQTQNMRDCAIIGRPSKFSSEIDGEKSLIHETGHALFDLQDEYCCDSYYDPPKCKPNIWKSESSCEQDALSIGLPKSSCAQITAMNDPDQKIDFWRIDPVGPTGCMMGDSQHEVGSDHGPADLRRMFWRLGRCVAGDCLAEEPCE